MREAVEGSQQLKSVDKAVVAEGEAMVVAEGKVMVVA